jgi:DNA-directed RNA polymerase subunit RPC12/RpoP
MSQVGVAACPKCGARYGVQESAAGQTLPCPACGTKFIVQPVARAADDFLPPSVDLAAGGPIVPASRVLEPIVYPHRDIPWVAISIAAGLCVVLFAIVFGSWKAYQVVAAAIGGTSVEQGNLVRAVPADLGTGAATDAVAGAAADAAHAVTTASQMIDKVATAVANPLLPPKRWPDTHTLCADESDRLIAELAELRADLPPEEAVRKLTDLRIRMEGLSIHWYLLPTITPAEHKLLRERYADSAKRFLDVERSDPTKQVQINDPQVLEAAGLLLPTISAYSAITESILQPIPTQNAWEEKHLEAAQIAREVCRSMHAVNGAADVNQVAAQVETQIARLKSARDELAGLTPPSASLFEHGMIRDRYGYGGLSRIVGMVCDHAVDRFAIAQTGQPLRGPTGQAAAQSAVVQDLRRQLLEIRQTWSSAQTAFDDVSRQTSAAAFARAGQSQPLGGSSAPGNSRLPPDGGPVVAIPPGFGPPPGFGLPPGFGPTPGFGGPSAGFGGQGPPTAESIDAEFEAKRQAFAQANGADRIVTVRASGGSPTQFRALELTLMRLIRPTSHSMQSVGTRFQMSVAFAGDVDRVANAITTGKVVSTDVTSRMIVVEFKQ